MADENIQDVDPSTANVTVSNIDTANTGTTTVTWPSQKAIDDAAAEAASAERAKILAELGIDDLGAATDAIERQRAAQEAAMTDAEKASAKAAKAQADAEKARAEAVALRQQATIELALTRHGVTVEQLGLVSRMVDVTDDADAEQVDAAVAALKEAMPAVFGQPTTPRPPTGSVTPPKPPSPSGNPPDRMQAGAARFAQMFPNAVANGSA